MILVLAEVQQEDPPVHNAVTAAKNLGINLRWLAKGSTVEQMANEDLLCNAIVHHAVHGVVNVPVKI